MSLVLYDCLPAGDGCKCCLLLKALGMPYELRQMDIGAGGAGCRRTDYPAISAGIARFKTLPWYAPIIKP